MTRRNEAGNAGRSAALQSARRRKAPFPAIDDLLPMPLEPDRGHVVRYLNCTTNKPLHIGHLRNIVLGDATAEALRALGVHAVKHCILEDTGQFMTQAMVAVAGAEAKGAVFRPGIDSARLVGSCYKRYREVRRLREPDCKPRIAAAAASTQYDADDPDADAMMRALLRGEPQAMALRDHVRELALTEQQATLRRMGVHFDYCDYESEEDPGLADFLARCEDKSLVTSTGSRERIWYDGKDGRLRLVNRGGLFEESARLLSFNCRVAATAGGSFRSIIFAGSEWKDSMRLYAQFLGGLGIDISETYLPTFYGMVTLNGKKMASSTGSGILIDDLLDTVAKDPRLVELSRQSEGRVDPDELAAVVVRSFLLAGARTEKLDFSLENLMSAEANPGWEIVSAWLVAPAASRRRPRAAIRAVVEEAVRRRSYETIMAEAWGLAGQIRKGRHDLADEFQFLLRALSLIPTRSSFSFRSAKSFQTVPAPASRSRLKRTRSRHRTV